ncbi:Lactonase, 7-bladed beta-propeller-domain-containing protein [Phascolomyces articulosus]|uniref:Lactonase, 7-bladed beta-propeller-domain-containing protein n=1 Tax=Phascolomyces articulosus TaxID=60185 RepID=A0AAD5PMN5_9FUNG|nr:Lactonase, 7-bladed beta-propeller-domain-containing protein [Phascolomyces articulosus]
MPVYVSGYTDNGGQGIYKYEWSKDGQLTGGELAAKAEAPSYFTIKRDTNMLYAVSELTDFQGTGGGTVIAFERNPNDGSLTEINEEATYGASPCYAVTDNDNIYTANYMSGSISVLPVSSDGVSPLGYMLNHTAAATGGVPDRQEAAHAHSFDFIDDTWAISCDLGTDQTIVYKRSEDGKKLEETGSFQFPNGTGPRHAAISRNKKHVYVLSELDSNVYVLNFDSKTGTLTQVEHHDADPAGPVDGGAEIELSPDGRFLYASVRFVNLITVFKIDQHSGKLTLVDSQSSGGDHPRQFKIDPSGRFLLVGNMNSDNIVIFKINQKTGVLEDPVTIDHPQPTCIKFWI